VKLALSHRSRLEAVRDVETGQAASPRRRRRARRLAAGAGIGAAVLLVGVPLGLWARYRLAHVVSRNAQVKGTIADVGSQLDGVVTQVEVDAGQRVEAGQILVRLEARHLRARVDQASSQLEKATRELQVERLAIAHERLRLDTRVVEASARLAAATAHVEAMQSQADDARERYELRKSLAKDGVISQEELRDAETLHRTATAQVATARAEQDAALAFQISARVESDGLAVRQERIAVLESEIAAWRAELAVAEADLEGSVIRAPDVGWVVRRILEPGASVTVGQPILSLWIGGNVWVEAWIDEDDLGKIGAGSPARVTLKSYPDRVFAGVVETIGVSTDYELPDTEVPQPRHARMRGTPVVGVRIRLDEQEGLLPGLSAVVGIRKQRPERGQDEAAGR
jgi:multidrug resistance efflux pump